MSIHLPLSSAKQLSLLRQYPSRSILYDWTYSAARNVVGGIDKGTVRSAYQKFLKSCEAHDHDVDVLLSFDNNASEPPHNDNSDSSSGSGCSAEDVAHSDSAHDLNSAGSAHHSDSDVACDNDGDSKMEDVPHEVPDFDKMSSEQLKAFHGALQAEKGRKKRKFNVSALGVMDELEFLHALVLVPGYFFGFSVHSVFVQYVYIF